ncbi:MAG: four helix bundle suffix domain-containing protein [Lentisphaerae bacterium]|nr:four helix bundle suffix domain-containing protein [Lentisphaerota bacterium]
MGAAVTRNGNDGRNENDGSHDSQNSHASHPILPPRGDYHTLLSFQKAEVVYDLTFRFAHKFLSRGDRTIDQMIQSARSGKKNILEGSKAALTSKETEIKLTNVGRASLEELLDDYLDFLRVRNLRLWEKDSKEALFVRDLGRKTPLTYEDFREFAETRSAEVVANMAICLIHQTNYLIDQQLRRLEQDFIEGGGLRERMTRARLDYRHRQNTSQNSQNSHPLPDKEANGLEWRQGVLPPDEQRQNRADQGGGAHDEEDDAGVVEMPDHAANEGLA